MSAIQEIFKQYGPEYMQRYGDSMPASHKKVIHAIQSCRNGDFGSILYQCESCGQLHIAPSSCGNRHCPTCQHGKALQWLEGQMENLLPCHYFLITFTVPEEIRPLLRTHQRVAYSVLFDAAVAALKKLALDPRFVGAEQIGCLGILHTWGRQLQYHPHIHFIVPGGGLSKDRTTWLSSKPNFFIRIEPLSRVYRAKFRDAMQKAGLLPKIDPIVWEKDWNVNSQPIGDGRDTLKYLAPYVFRVAISNSRIVSYDNHKVTFKYRKSHSSRLRKISVDALEFIRRFLQHVLPTGFMKIRHYGFLNPNAETSIQEIRERICMLYEIVKEFIPKKEKPHSKTFKCLLCGQCLRWKTFIPAFIPTG